MTAAELAPRPPRRPIIEARRVVKTYATGTTAVHALRDLSFVIERGDFVAIMGASGSGKSTLMNILGCLDLPTRGRYLLDGIDVREFDEYELVAGAQPEDRLRLPELQPDPANLGAAERGAAARLCARQAEGAAAARGRRAPRGRSRASGCTTCRPSSRAGSSSVRPLLARSSPIRPCCSPTSRPATSIRASTAELLQVFCRLNVAGRTIVLITHEPEVAAACKRVIVLRDGRIVEDQRSAPLLAAPPGLVPPALAGRRATA